MSEVTGAMSEKALHILRAAVEDARGEPGVYVSRARVMEQSGVSDLEEFEQIAQDLAERGFIDKGITRYEFFVVTLKGIGAGATEAAEAVEPPSEEAASTHAPPVPERPIERPSSWWRRFFV